MQKIKSITVLDIVLIILLISCSFYIQRKFDSKKMGSVIVYIDNKIYAKYDLQKDNKYEINGALGNATLVIDSGTAELIESPCSHQICVKTGKIKNPSSQIVCAPGHIMVRVESKKVNNGVDAIVQ